MEEMLIIPRAEAPILLAKHSAKLLEDGRMTQAARFAAQQERILKDPLLADDEAVQRVKPVSRRLRKAVKKLRQLNTQPLTSTEQTAQDQELVTPAFTKWMQRMVRPTPAPPTSPKIKSEPPPKIKTETPDISLISPVKSPRKRPATTGPPAKKKKVAAAPKKATAPKKKSTPVGVRQSERLIKKKKRSLLSPESKKKVRQGVRKGLRKSLEKAWKAWDK